MNPSGNAVGDNGDKIEENEKLREELNQMKRMIAELTETLNETSDTKELRSSHPPIILEKDSNFDTWEQIVKIKVHEPIILH